MELYQIYRKNALRPWIIFGAIVVAAMIYLVAVWRGDYSAIPLLLVLYLVPFAISTFRLWTGSGARGYRAYADSHTPEELEELFQQYEHGKKLGQAILTDRHLIFLSRQHLDIIPYGDIVWVYQVGRITKIIGGTTYVTVLVTRDRKNYNIDIVGKEPELREYFAAIREKNPGTVVGQDKDVSRLYKKDFAGLLALVDQRKADAQPAEEADPQTLSKPETDPPAAPGETGAPDRTEEQDPAAENEESQGEL